jgi:hypothetical protein
MKKSNRSTVIRLFFCLVLVLVVISCSIFSSLRTVTAANSTFGFYFGSPTINTTGTATKNPNSLKTVTAANSTFGFYFGSPIANATAKAKALTTPAAAIHTSKSGTNKHISNGQMLTLKSWSIIPSLYQNK